MRERKFKVWDSRSKAWRSPGSVSLSLSTGMLYAWDDPGFSKPLEHLKLVEWTGRKDINGRDVYEHDLLGNGTLFLGEVIFDEGMFTCENRIGTPIRRRDFFALEVKGNMVENPELLEQAA